MEFRYVSMKKIILLTIGTMVLSSCNPFGKYSIININPGEFLFNQPTNIDLNSGGKTSPTIPSSGQPTDVHKITYKVGTQFTQQIMTTGDGHGVNIMLRGKMTQ